eukprot:NODE_1253_length_1618_cov_29.059273_g1118_i0.p1 GENE.NODE_1253_length_1618_cov_29.059273_g1118_i0~~NODE_1253_length_1618_cov_29.059273_g1118_i0.p1  ORF type:complete len:246 (+),score=33.91 NODE_1253_length_1618_cov_29.059273_g1118_i0:879-1616(+)
MSTSNPPTFYLSACSPVRNTHAASPPLSPPLLSPRPGSGGRRNSLPPSPPMLSPPAPRLDGPAEEGDQLSAADQAKLAGHKRWTLRQLRMLALGVPVNMRTNIVALIQQHEDDETSNGGGVGCGGLLDESELESFVFHDSSDTSDTESDSESDGDSSCAGDSGGASGIGAHVTRSFVRELLARFEECEALARVREGPVIATLQLFFSLLEAILLTGDRSAIAMLLHRRDLHRVLDAMRFNPCTLR